MLKFTAAEIVNIVSGR